MKSAHALLFSLFLTLVLSKQFGLYGIITDFEGVDTETVVHTVTVNPISGQVLRIITNFIYVGGSATYDGISALDTDLNHFYYVNDGASPFMYNVDLAKQQLLPTVSAGLQYISTLAYDDMKKRILVYGMVENPQTKQVDKFLISYSTSQTQKSGVVTQFPQFDEIVGSSVDSKNQIYHFVAYNNSQEYLASYDIAKNSVSNLNKPSCNITVDYAFAFDTLNYHPEKGLRAIAESDNPLTYYYVTLKETGACVAHAIKPSELGIGTTFAFDPNTDNIYIGWAPNGPAKVITYNTKTLSITKEVALSDGFGLEDLTVAYI